jgi:hypothetical protein
MKVRLLNRRADKEKNRAYEGKQKMSAHFECPILTYFPHLYPITIRQLRYSPDAAQSGQYGQFRLLTNLLVVRLFD